MKNSLFTGWGFWGLVFDLAASVVIVVFVLVFLSLVSREALLQTLIWVGGFLALLWILRGLVALGAMVQFHRMDMNDQLPPAASPAPQPASEKPSDILPPQEAREWLDHFLLEQQGKL